MKYFLYGFSKLKSKILLLVIIAVGITVLVNLMTVVPEFEDRMIQTTQNSMYDLAMSYGSEYDMLTYMLQEKGIVGDLEEIASVLENVSVSGMPSSYVYLVAKDGTMLYHPSPDKIGEPVENDIVSGLVKELNAGRTPEPDFVEYEFKGAIKYASYYISKADSSILVITADESDITSSLEEIYNKLFYVTLFTCIFVAIITLLVAATISRPLTKLTKIVDQTAALDFTPQTIQKKLSRRRDETGMISRSIEKMRDNISDIMNQVSGISEKLDQSSHTIHTIAEQVNEHSTSNSATSQQLSASMEETASATETINISTEQMDINSKGISQLTMDGEVMTEEIMERAAQMGKSALDTSDKTKQVYISVKEKTGKAMEHAKSVNKIQEMTKTIMSIASQTRLLSLNASIEAARAGEEGRGFAVVAGEIGNLAAQSTSTVANIIQIVEEVQGAVMDMTSCLSETLDFLENAVLGDYAQFIKVSSQYSDDALSMDQSMKTVRNGMDELQSTINNITTSVRGISETMTEATEGVGDMAEKISETVLLTTKTVNLVESNLADAVHLKKLVDRFILKAEETNSL